MSAAASPASPASPPPVPPARWWRRRGAIVAAIIAAVLLVVILFVVVAPRYIARYVADRYFTGIDVDVEGVKTIDIDLLDGTFAVGPVRFRGSGSEPADAGTFGLLGVKISLSDLFDKQALVRRAVVRDVDLAIRQDADGELSINGVPLRQILAKRAEQAQSEPPPAEPEKASAAWGTGIDNLEVRDVRVAFTNRDGGTARLVVDYLDLNGFRSWEPDHPGRFLLKGDVNGIEVNASGTARPFAEKITADVEAGISGIDLTRIEEFTGPLGFDPTNGTLTVFARSKLELFPDGRVDGTADTTLVLANIDAARLAGASVKLDQGSVVLSGHYNVQKDGALAFDGRGDVKLNQASSEPAAGTQVALAAASLTLTDIALAKQADGALSLKVQPLLDVERPAVQGPADAAADRLVVDLAPVAVARAADGTTTVQTATGGAAAPGAGGDATKAAQADGDSRGSGRIDLTTPVLRAPAAFRADTLGFDLAALALQIDAAGKMTVDAQGTLRATGGEAKPPSAPNAAATTVRFGEVTAPLGPLTVVKDGGQLRLSGPASLKTQALDVAIAPPAPAQGAAPSPSRLSAKTAALTLTDVKATQAGADVRLDAGIGSELTGVTASWPAAVAAPGGVRGRAAPADGQLALDSLRLGPKPLRVAIAGGKTTVAGDVTTELANLTASVPADPQQAPWKVALGKFSLGLSGIDSEIAPTVTTGTAKLDISATGIAAEQAAPSLPRAPANNRTRYAVQSLRVAPAQLGLRIVPDRLAVTGEAATQVEGIVAELPRTDRNPQAVAGIRNVRAQLSEITADQAGTDLAWSVRMDMLADGLTNRTEGGKLATLDLRSISIGDLRADHRRKAAVERIVLDHLDAFLTRDYLFASTVQEESRPKQAVETVQKAAEEGWKFQLGSLSTVNGAQIRLRDATVDPNTNATIDIQSLQVLNLNTGDPAQKTQIRTEATINQFTELAVAGWAAPFGTQPDFDLNARLRRLELPTLSVYAAKAIGLNVESGRLSLDVTASANEGNLKGLLDLTLRDLGFSPLSPQDAQRLSAAVGVPIETIVGLLQDDEGRIKLSLPVSGNLASPSFDPTDAIRQALTGAVQAAVLAPFQLAFAPVALIAKAAGAGGTMAIQPILFPAGVATLDDAAEEQVNGLVRVLAERDRLTLRVCGRATASDLTAALAAEGAPASGPERDAASEKLAPQLWSLAGERTSRTRDALITQGGAKARQVGECRILYDPTDTGPPRVEITL